MPTEFTFEEASQPAQSFTFEEATARKSFSFEEATATATTPAPSVISDLSSGQPERISRAGQNIASTAMATLAPQLKPFNDQVMAETLLSEQTGDSLVNSAPPPAAAPEQRLLPTLREAVQFASAPFLPLEAAGEFATKLGQDIVSKITGDKRYGGNLRAWVTNPELQSPAEKFIAESAKSAPTTAFLANLGKQASEMSPMLGVGAVPGVAGRAVASAFAGQMGLSFYDSAMELEHELAKPKEQQDAGKIAELKASVVSSGLFGALATVHAATPGKPAISPELKTLAPETAQAISEQQPYRSGITKFDTSNVQIEQHGEMISVPAKEIEMETFRRPSGKYKPKEPNASSQPSPTGLPSNEIRPGVDEEASLRQQGQTSTAQTEAALKETQNVVQPENVAPIEAVAETPVLGGSEANLPAQQREQSRRNNEAQAAQMRAELEAMGVKIPEKATTPPESSPAVPETVKVETPPPQPPPAPEPAAGKEGEIPKRLGKGGPGAAAATEPGTYDPAAQLADALKTVKGTDPLKRAEESNRIAEAWEAGKDAVTKAWGRVVAAKESLKSNLLTLPEATPLKRLVAALDFQIQKSSALSRDLGKTFEQTHPSRTRRNGIAVFVDAGLDAEKVRAAIAELPAKTPRRIRKAFEAAADLTAAERDTAERIKNYFEQRLQDAQQAGVLKGFLEDYYTHVWKKPERMPSELRNAMSNGRVVTYFENARERKLDDFITGVKLGYEPVLDPALVLPRYNFNLDRAIASRAFIKKLTDTTEADGRPTVAPTGTGRQISTTEYVVKNNETGRTRRVFETKDEADAVVREGESVVERENTASLISPKAKSAETADYRPVDNPALKKWKWATNTPEGTPIIVEGDLIVHPDALQRVKNMMERERLTAGTTMRGLIRAGAEVKGAKLGVLSPFHQIHVGSHAVWHLVNPFSLKPEIDWTHPATKFAVEKGGLKLAADFHDKMAFSEGIGPGLIVQKIVPYARAYSEYLFESFIPRLKLKTFEAVYQRDLKRYAGKLTPDQIAARAGDAVNSAYGELNRLWLGKDGRDPRLQRAMQVTLLAADFLEARGRFLAKAFTKYGKEERMALFIMGSGLYTASRVLNQLIDGDPHAKEPNMAFSVRIKDKNYSIRSVLGDAAHLLTDWRSFASTRINPLTTRTVVETLTQRDIRTGESRTTPEQAADMLRQIVPSQLDSMLPGDRQWWFGFMQSIGVTARHQPTPQEIAKKTIKEEKEKLHPSKVEIIYKKGFSR